MASLLLTVVLLGCLSALSQAFHRDDLIFLVDESKRAVFVVNATSEQETKIPLTNVAGIWNVDFDPLTRRVYWTDRDAHTLNSARMDGSDQEVLLTLNTTGDSPVAVAVDPFRHLVFYTREDPGTIEVVGTDGGNQHVVHHVPGEIYGLALDMLNEVIYYNVINNTAQIGRVHYNGSDNQIMLNSSSSLDMCGLTLDLTAGRMYWSSKGENTVQSSRLDGSDRKTVLETSMPLFITLLGDTLIFSSDSTRTQLHKVRTDGTQNGTLGKPVFGKIQGVASYSPSTFFPLAQKLAPPDVTDGLLRQQLAEAVQLNCTDTGFHVSLSLTTLIFDVTPNHVVLGAPNCTGRREGQSLVFDATYGSCSSVAKMVGSKMHYSTVLFYQEGNMTVLATTLLRWSVSLVCPAPGSAATLQDSLARVELFQDARLQHPVSDDVDLGQKIFVHVTSTVVLSDDTVMLVQNCSAVPQGTTDNVTSVPFISEGCKVFAHMAILDTRNHEMVFYFLTRDFSDVSNIVISCQVVLCPITNLYQAYSQRCSHRSCDTDSDSEHAKVEVISPRDVTD